MKNIETTKPTKQKESTIRAYEHNKRENQVYKVRANGTLDVGTENNEDSLAQQQFKDQSDINNIIKKYNQTGELPLTQKVGQFIDISNIGTLQESYELIQKAEQAFMDLPSKIRTRFENNPTQLHEFIMNSSNREEAIELGLIDKPETITQTPPTQTQT